MNNEITIEKREYEAKAGKAVAVGLNRMEQCDEIVKGERAGKVMANLAAVMFHLKETTRAMSAMGVELFRDNERVTLTVKEFDEAAKELLDREGKKKAAIQEDGQYMPLQLLVAGIMAWNLAFQELRHVLFDEERDEKKEFHQAMGRIKEAAAKEKAAAEAQEVAAVKVEPWVERVDMKVCMDAAADSEFRHHAEMDAMKLRAYYAAGQTAWTDESQQPDTANTEPPEQSGLANVNAAAAEEQGADPAAPDGFVQHIRQRFGF